MSRTAAAGSESIWGGGAQGCTGLHNGRRGGTWTVQQRRRRRGCRSERGCGGGGRCEDEWLGAQGAGDGRGSWRASARRASAERCWRAGGQRAERAGVQSVQACRRAGVQSVQADRQAGRQSALDAAVWVRGCEGDGVGRAEQVRVLAGAASPREGLDSDYRLSTIVYRRAIVYQQQQQQRRQALSVLRCISAGGVGEAAGRRAACLAAGTGWQRAAGRGYEAACSAQRAACRAQRAACSVQRVEGSEAARQRGSRQRAADSGQRGRAEGQNGRDGDAGPMGGRGF